MLLRLTIEVQMTRAGRLNEVCSREIQRPAMANFNKTITQKNQAE